MIGVARQGRRGNDGAGVERGNRTHGVDADATGLVTGGAASVQTNWANLVMDTLLVGDGDGANTGSIHRLRIKLEEGQRHGQCQQA